MSFDGDELSNAEQKRADAKFSREAFPSLVWPTLAPHIPGSGRFVSNETKGAGVVAEFLDRHGYTDGFQHRIGGGVVPIAQRTRRYKGGSFWRQFTIRWARRPDDAVPDEDDGQWWRRDDHPQRIRTEWDKLRKDAADDQPIRGWIVTSWCASATVDHPASCLWASFARADFFAAWCLENEGLLLGRVKQNKDRNTCFSYVDIDDFPRDRVAYVELSEVKRHVHFADRVDVKKPAVWVVLPKLEEDLSLHLAGKTFKGLSAHGQPRDEAVLATIYKHNITLGEDGKTLFGGPVEAMHMVELWLRYRSDAALEWARAQCDRWAPLRARREAIAARMAHPVRWYPPAIDDAADEAAE